VSFPRQFSFSYPYEPAVASVGIEAGDEPLSIYVVGCKDHGTEGNAQPRRCGFNDQKVMVVEADFRWARHRGVEGWFALSLTFGSSSDSGNVQLRAVYQTRQAERCRIDARRVVYDELCGQMAKPRAQTEAVA
jgi:hypothetical protein